MYRIRHEDPTKQSPTKRTDSSPSPRKRLVASLAASRVNVNPAKELPFPLSSTAGGLPPPPMTGSAIIERGNSSRQVCVCAGNEE